MTTLGNARVNLRFQDGTGQESQSGRASTNAGAQSSNSGVLGTNFYNKSFVLLIKYYLMLGTVYLQQ